MCHISNPLLLRALSNPLFLLLQASSNLLSLPVVSSSSSSLRTDFRRSPDDSIVKKAFISVLLPVDRTFFFHDSSKFFPSDMEKICMIVDMDGFYFGVGGRVVREYAYASLTKDIVATFRFDLTRRVPWMTYGDWRLASYYKNRVNGLSVRPLPREPTFREDELRKIIVWNYESNKTEREYLVAYKGGEVERKILTELEIKSIDLEWFDCPKYDDLVPNSNVVKKVEDCGFHMKVDGNVYCPKKECAVFREWVQRKKISNHSRNLLFG